MTEHAADYRSFPATDPAEGANVWVALVIENGERYLRQELIEVAARSTLPRDRSDLEMLLFVVSGTGRLTLAGPHELKAGTGARVPPREAYELTAHDEPLLVVSVAVHGRESAEDSQPMTVSLSDQRSDAATAAREYRMLFGPVNGYASATQFVGYIPRGRAPDHYHEYDEVAFVLEGHGVLHIGGASTPAASGTCIRFPARVVHSLENVRDEPLVVLGVFCPAGSPAAAFYPDGTPAHPPTVHA